MTDKANATLLTSKDVVSREDVLTVIQTSFIVEEARAIVSLQTFHNGLGAQCNSIMVHPDTARVLARILNNMADEYERHVARAKWEEGHDAKD